MKKAILFSMLLLFSVFASQIVLADNFTDKPEKVKVCDLSIDFDFVSNVPVVMATKVPNAFEPIREVIWREKDVGNFLILNRYAYKKGKLNPEHFLPDIRRLMCHRLGASF